MTNEERGRAIAEKRFSKVRVLAADLLKLAPMAGGPEDRVDLQKGIQAGEGAVRWSGQVPVDCGVERFVWEVTTGDLVYTLSHLTFAPVTPGTPPSDADIPEITLQAPAA